MNELSPVGVAAKVLKVFQLPDERPSALVQLLQRVQPMQVVRNDPFLILQVIYPVEIVSDEEAFEAVYRQTRITIDKFFAAHPSVPDELKMAVNNISVPGVLADFIAQHLSRNFEERLSFLIELDLPKRLRRALEVAIREVDLLNVGNRISEEIREKVEKHQRDFFLREQLKAIRVELGDEKDPATLAVEELEKKLEEAGLPEAARERADAELKRLQLLPAESPEHSVVRSYLDWIASLPWAKTTDDNADIERARAVLDQDHYGLEEVKDRIIEFLAVRQLNPNNAGSLLCFAGPPGVGKTSLGKSIARALGREFYRFSVGGMRDEAEIKGHRRTYVGAMPGRMIQALKQVGTANPVLMLDELDKMGSDWRGDPSSAMLEVLDPAQNSSFLDHYLDLNFDLSRVMFIATANVKTEIPGPLLDRLEVIDLPGYIPEEKVEIASRYLLPRQRKNHGLSSRQLQMGKPCLRRMVREYTHEAGVRELDRLIGKVCRKRATEVVEGKKVAPAVRAQSIPAFLGPPKIHEDRVGKRHKPGVAVGLAWTPMGGDVLFIEIVHMPGKGDVKVTGHLGEVMTESASIAMSYVRHQAATLGIPREFFEKNDIHVHFPAGAVPKDGPSAGVTITTALISLLTDTPIQPRLAMTGEMTLRGEVLPVGGIREKVVAARRAGIRTVIVPERNRADVDEIPIPVREKIDFVFAESYQQVLLAAFAGRLGTVAATSSSLSAKANRKATRRERSRSRRTPAKNMRDKIRKGSGSKSAPPRKTPSEHTRAGKPVQT
ncbi:MAG: endopeptidase La [Myxococcota bacterium]